MKNALLVIFAIASIALGALCWNQQAKVKQQSAQLAEAQKQLAAVQAEMKAKADAIDRAKFTESKADVLQKTLTETAASAAEQSKKAEQLQQSLAAAKTNNPMRAMAEMFKDPKMREMIKSQQKAVMGPMIQKQYAALFDQLGLSPEQSASFKELLQNKMLAGADAGMSMMDDSLDATQRADLAKQIKAQSDDYDNQIKQMLGDQNYDAYKAYEKLAPDRMAVSQFGDQLGSGDMALNTQQQDALTQALNEARIGFHWTADLNQGQSGANSADFLSRLTEDNIAKFATEREQFDEQFLTRAAQILTAQQLAAYQDFQKTQRQMQLMGLRMAAQMFGAKN